MSDESGTAADELALVKKTGREARVRGGSSAHGRCSSSAAMLMGLAAPVLGRARAGVVAFALLCGLATLVLPWESLSQWQWQSARQWQSVPHARG